MDPPFPAYQFHLAFVPPVAALYLAIIGEAERVFDPRFSAALKRLMPEL